MDMNQYLDMFIEESKEHLQAINSNLLTLETDPHDIGIVNEIFRSAHTLKGMAATMGFEDLASLTHEMENVLDLIRNQKLMITTDIMDVIFKSVDIMEGMVQNIMEGGDGAADVSSLVGVLRSIVAGDFNEASSEPTATIAEDDDSDAETNDQVEEAQAVTRDYQLDDYAITIMRQSQETGNNLYWIRVSLQAECVLKAARAYMVFDQLDTHGEVIKSTPSVEEIENEKFDRSFEVVYINSK